MPAFVAAVICIGVEAITSSSNGSPPSRSLLARTARGAGWVIGWRLSTRLLGMGSTLVLVRLLTPSDFGLVALATGLIVGLDGIAGFGVEGAIIRIDHPGRDVYDAGFTMTVLRGLLTAIVMAIGAVPMARFFDNPDLAPAVWVLSAGWALSSFRNIGMVEYRRTLAFDMEFKFKIIPRLLALGITLPAAFIWHSYWALIAGILATQFMTVGLSYVMHPYRPWFGVKGMPKIFAFSFWEWIIGTISMVGGRADTFIVGRVLGTGAVGIYNVAGEIATLPSGEIVAPLCRVLFSGFVEESRSGSSGANTLVRVMGFLFLLILPLNVGMSLVANPVVRLCFGEQWLGAVPLIQLLGVAAALGMVQAVAESLFSANAWLRTILWMVIVTTVVRIALLIVLIPSYGLIGGAIAATAVGILNESIHIAVGMRRVNLDLGALLRGILRPVLAASCMAFVLYVTGLGWHSGPTSWLALGEAIGLGGVVYVGALLGLWLAVGRPHGAEAELLGMVQRTIGRRTA